MSFTRYQTKMSSADIPAMPGLGQSCEMLLYPTAPPFNSYTYEQFSGHHHNMQHFEGQKKKKSLNQERNLEK